MKMKKLAAILLASVMTIGLLAGCGGSSDSEGSSSAEGTVESSGKQVAAIFGGAINDGNWNETQYNGLKNIESKGATINYLENIADADSAEAARTYASEGYDLVYLTTNSYQDYCKDIASQFPDTTFIQVNGTEITDNFISIRIADEEQGFMQGVIAALLTKTGKVGFIGGMEINPIKLGSLGFQQGVDYANKNFGLNVEAKRVNTGDFTDVNKAKETAIAMIDSGVDVVASMANDASVGVMEAAEEKGVMAVGCGEGQDTSAPNATQIIVVKDVSIAYDVTYDDFEKGSLAPTEVETYGANKGVVFLTDWIGDVDDTVKGQVADTMEKMKNGEITISTAE